MKLRTIMTAAALAVVSTLGMTVPLATPAAAASCGTVDGVAGSNARYRTDLQGNYSMTWSATLRAAAFCSTSYKYEQFIYEGGTLYGRSAVYGTTGNGTATFADGTTSMVPAGTTRVTYGVRVSVFDRSTFSYKTVSEHIRRIDVVGYTFDTSTGQHAYLVPCSSDGISYGYSQPCLPIPF